MGKEGGLQSYRSAPSRLASRFDTVYVAAIRSPAAARKRYPTLLDLYQRLLSSDASVAVKSFAYQKTSQVYRLAQSSGVHLASPRMPSWMMPLSFILLLLALTLFLRPGITGFFGIETRSVSEALALSSSSSSGVLTLQGIPDSLVFDGTWNGQGIGRGYVVFEGGRRLLAVDTTQLPTVPGQQFHFTSTCVETCDNLNAPSNTVTVQFEVSDGAELLIDQVTYTTSENNPPEWVGATNTFEITDTLTIDLAPLFFDPDGDTLTFLATAPELLRVSLDGSRLTMTPEPGFTSDTVSVIASDGIAIAQATLIITKTTPFSPTFTATPIQEPTLATTSLLTTEGFHIATSISACGTISVNSELTVDLSNQVGTCFTIGANNVVLDCQGHLVDGDLGGSDYGVTNTGFDNVTVTGCRITDFSIGVRFLSGANNGTIRNNTVDAKGTATTGDPGYGVSIASSNNNTIINNSLGGTGASGPDGDEGTPGGSGGNGAGVLLSDSNGTNIINNRLTGKGGAAGADGGAGTGSDGESYGLRATTSLGLNITGNAASAAETSPGSGTALGIWVTGANRSVIEFNKANDTTNAQIRLDTTSNTTVRGNNVSGTNGIGIYLVLGSIFNFVTDNIANISSQSGIGAALSSTHNTISGNTVTSVSGGGIFATSAAHNNTIANNTATTLSGSAFTISGSNNTLLNNRGSSRTGFGLQVASSSTRGIFIGNNFTSHNGTALWLTSTSQNNSFVNTTIQANVTWLMTTINSSLNNFTDTVFTRGNGSIRVVPKVSVPTNANATLAKLNISFNRAFMNVTNLTFFNTSATIVLNISSLGLGNPAPQVDYDDDGTSVACPADVCTEQNFTNGIYTFNVSHWTTFSAAAGGNSAPSISSVILNTTNPSNNNTNQNLTLYLSGVLDADNDSVQNITDWRRHNGTSFASIAVINMPFETNTTSTTTDAIRDYGSWQNHGTLGNGTAAFVPAWTPNGKRGGAFTFDGSNDFIEIADSDSLDVSSITLIAWVNTTSAGIQPIINRDNNAGAGTRIFQFRLEPSGVLHFIPFFSGASDSNIGSISVNDGLWHQVAATYNSATGHVRLYVDGVLDYNETQAATPLDTGSTHTFLGKFDDGGTILMFSGQMDEVLMLNRSLSQQQIASLFTEQNGTRPWLTLHANETETGEVWQAAVTPNDDADDGTTVLSNNVTILQTLNEAPSISQVILNSTNARNSTNGDLNVYVIGASDADGSIVRNITDWREHNGTDFVSWNVLNMPFETNLSVTTLRAIRDYSSFANNGTLGNGTAANVPVWNNTGRAGGAYRFDGSNDRIEIPNSQIMDFTDNYTLEAWVNITTHKNYNPLFVRGSTAGDDIEIYFNAAPQTVLVHNRGNGGTTVTQILSNVPTAGQWTHVVVTFVKGTWRYYLNGERVSTTTGNAAPLDTNKPWLIGATLHSDFGGTGFFGGQIDEAKLYNRVLTAEQVRKNYLEGSQSRQYQALTPWELVAGDVWQVAVTPNDNQPNTDGTTVLSNNLTVQNSTPSVGQVILNTTNPASNNTNQNLTAYISGVSDPDNDAVVNITDWRRNGVSLALLNVPFETNATNFSNSIENRTIIKDYSQFGNNGTLGDGTHSQEPIWNSSGKVGGSYKFDGTDDRIDFGTPVSLNSMLTKNFTIEAWIYINDTDDGAVVNRGDSAIGGQNKFIGFSVTATPAMIFQVRGDAGEGSTATITGGTMLRNTWYHVVAVRNKGVNVQLYVNGQQNATPVADGAGDITFSATRPLNIGAANVGFSPSSFFKGQIDEVRIYNRTLTRDQINLNYQAGLANRSPEVIIKNETAAGETWSVAVTGNDHRYDSATVLSNNVTIQAATACGTINASTTMDANLSSTGTCFTMACNDCFLDCDGYAITYATGTGIGAGITAASRANITIKNCNVLHGGGGSAGIVGINLTSITAGLIKDSLVTVNGTTDSDGIALRGNTSQLAINNVSIRATLTGSGTLNSKDIRLAGASNTVLIDQVNITSSTLGITGARGPVSIHLENVSNVLIEGNAFSANSTNTGGQAVVFSGTAPTNITVKNNTMNLYSTAAGTNAISVAGKDHAIFNNTISSSAATSGIIGIRVAANATNVSQNRVFVNGTTPKGLSADTGINSLFEDNVVTIIPVSATQGTGLESTTSALNNTFRRNNVTFVGTTTNTMTIFVSNQANLTWFDSNILTGDSTGTSIGVLIQNSYGTRFTGNTFKRTFVWVKQENVSGFPQTTANYTGNLFAAEFGSINITPRIQLNGTFNFTQEKLNVTLNRSYTNATNLTFFNTSSVVTLNLSGLGLVNPNPMLDSADTGTFVSCPESKCTEQSFTNSIFVFNVSSWTTFSASETTGCGSKTSSVTLTENATSTGVCVTLDADNIVLDCAGFTITYGTAGAGGAAIVASGRTNVTVRNCVIVDTTGGAFGVGINLTNTNESRLFNNTIRTNGTNDNYGINLRSANRNLIDSNTIRTNGTGNNNYGISFTAASTFNNITANDIATDGDSGNTVIILQSSSDNNRIRNNTLASSGVTASNFGVDAQGVSANEISGNTVTTDGTSFNLGISVQSSSTNNVVSGNAVVTGGSVGNNWGLYVAGTSTGNNLSDNNVTTSGASGTNYGVLLDTSSTANSFHRNHLSTGGGTDSYGISTSTTSGNLFNNTILNRTVEWILTSTGSSANLTNTTYRTDAGSIRQPDRIQINASTTLTTAKLNITSNRAFLNVTSLTGFNRSATITLNGLTFTDAQAVVDYEDDGTNVTCPANVCTEVSYTGGVFVFNVSHWTTFQTQEFVSDCSTLTASSTLTNSVSSTGTCFIIAANDVTLDCAGFGITYDTSGAGGASGVLAFNRSNLVVKNCNIADINASGALSTGINFTLVNNSQVFNNTIQTNGTTDNYGVLIRGTATLASGGNQVFNNTIRTRGTTTQNFGVYLTGLNRFASIINNTILTNGTSTNQGVRFDSGTVNSTVKDNVITAGGTGTNNHGISLQAGANQHNVSNNIVRTFTGGTTYGIESQANDVSITGNNVGTKGTSTGNHGIVMNTALRNVARNNIVRVFGSAFNYGILTQTTTDAVVDLNDVSVNLTGGSGQAIYLFSSATRTNVTNNTIVNLDSSGSGVRIETTSINNIIRNNTITTNGPSTNNYGVHLLSTSTGNIIDNNIIHTNGSSTGQNGVRIESSSHNVIGNNTITTNGTTGNHGLHILSTVTNITAANNVITTGGTSTSASPTSGIRLETSVTDSRLTNNTILVTNTGTGSQGILIGSSSSRNNISMTTITIPSNVNATGVRVEATSLNNTFNYTTISVNNDPALSISTSNTTRFFNTFITARRTWVDAVTTQINLTNTTFNYSAGSIRYPDAAFSAGTVNVTAAKLNTSLNRAYLNATNLTFLNIGAFITFLGLNVTDHAPTVDFEDDGTFASCAASVCTEITDSAGTYAMNVSHWTTFSAQEADTCGNITASKTLINDLTSVNTCFAITANNVVLDCDGHSIIGNRTAGSQGVNASARTNITVKNCYIANFTDGLFFTRVLNSVVYNNTFFNSSDDGLDFNNVNFTLVSHNNGTNNFDNNFEFSGIGNNITNNTAINARGSAFARGFEMADISNDNQFTNNTAYSNQDDGLLITLSQDNTLTGNTAFENGNDGILITESIGHVIRSNLARNNSDDGIEIAKTNFTVIDLNNASRNFDNNIIIDRGFYNNATNNTASYAAGDTFSNGIAVVNFSDGNRIVNNTLSNNQDDGLQLINDTRNTFIASNVILGNGDDGLDVSNTSGHNITLNDFQLNRFGIALTPGIGIQIYNNTFANNTDDGIFVSRNSTNVIVRDNTVLDHLSANGNGINVFTSNNTHQDNISITGNFINRTGDHGIVVSNDSSNITIARNSVYSSGLSSIAAAGIRLFDVKTANVSRNIVVNASIGLEARLSEHVIIEYNTLQQINKTFISVNLSNNTAVRNNTIEANGRLELEAYTVSNVTIIDSAINNYTISLSRVTVRDTDEGEIAWRNYSMTQAGVNLSRDVNIAPNQLRVNVTNAPGFNNSANLTLNSITFADPEPRVDYEDDGTNVTCPVDVCTEISYNVSGNQQFLFNVSHWTTFSAAQTNIAPSIAQVILNTTNPATNDTSQNLTVYVINATDADGNAVQNITDWQKHNGTGFTSLALLNMPFETNTAVTTAGAVRDYSTYANNGTLSSATWNVTGKVGGAYTFAGTSSSKLSVADNDYWDFPGNFTLVTWVNWGATPCANWWECAIIAHDQGSGVVPKWILSYDTSVSKTIFHFQTAGVTLYGSAWTLSANTWYQIALTRNGSTFTFYRNGVVDGAASSSSALSNAAASLTVGYGEGASAGFAGSIDEVLIFNRSLSAAQINQIYNETSAGRQFTVMRSSELRANDIWQNCVTPNDALFDGTTVCSNNVTILAVAAVDNAAPTIAQVILNTTNPVTNDTNQNLTVYIINATDADGNAVQNITDWRKHNGTGFTSITVLNMPFETNSSNTSLRVIRDYSTFNNNGTLGNGTESQAPVWTSSGIVGGAYVFDGVNDTIDLGIDSSFNFGSGNFTYEAWIKINQSGVNSRIISQDRNLANHRALGVFSLTNKSFFTCRDSSSNQMAAVGNSTVTDGNWHHLVGVRNGSTALIYVDGVLENTTTNSAVGSCDGDAATRIGSRVGTSLFFNGTIDEVRIYNHSLTASQIRQNYLDGNASRHSMIVHADATSISDVWQTCATPNDNITDGTTVCSNNVTILTVPNSAPTIAQVSLNSTNPVTNDTNQNLTVYIINATDADGNAVQNITDWRLANSTGGFQSIAFLNMPFENNLSSLSTGAVSDYGTYKQNGTLGAGSSSLAPAWNSSGRVGGAYNFDGSDDYIEVADSDFVDIPAGANRTVMLWIYRTAAGNIQHIMGKRTGCSGGGTEWQIAFDTFNGPYGLFCPGAISGENPPIGQWVHVACVINGTTSRLYRNATLNATGTSDAVAGTAPLKIGGSGTCTPFGGLIDEVLIFNRALSSGEITRRYADGLASHKSTELHNTETAAGDVWQTCATPNDALTDGTTVCSNNVTITNAAPSISSVILNSTDPATNDTNQNLTTHVINATDADGDAIQNITDWRLHNGTGFASIAIVNLPFDTNVTGVATDAVRDYSTFQNNGTLGGGTSANAPVWRGGRAGGAYLFDGSDDYVSVDDDDRLNLANNSFTIALWVNFTSLDTADALIAHDTGGGTTNKWVLYRDGTNIIFLIAGPSITTATPITEPWTPATGAWQHLVVTRYAANGSYVLYINGTLYDTGTDTQVIPDPSVPLTVGWAEGIYFTAAEIDEVLILNRSLSAAQVSRLFQDGSAGRHMGAMHAAETSVGEIWQTCVTPNDAFVDGATVCSNNLTIQVAGGTVSCGNINTSTNLTSSITSTGTCFNLTGDDLVLNCAGYSITGDTSGYGVKINPGQDNVTIANCTFINFTAGVYADPSNLTIEDSIFENNTVGLELFDTIASRVRRNIFRNNTVGLRLNSSNGNNLTNNSYSQNNISAVLIDSLDNRFNQSSLPAQFVIENSTHGMINFTQQVNFTTTVLLSDVISIQSNSIFVNGTQVPALNVPAKLTFRGLGFTRITPIYDANDDGVFSACAADRCTNISYASGTFIMNVTGFTTYATDERIDALAAYRADTGSNTTPRIRVWNSTGEGSWGSEITLPTAGSTLVHLTLKHATNTTSWALLTQSLDGFLDLYTCSRDCDASSNWTVTSNIGQVWSSLPGPLNESRADIAFERDSGDLLITYGLLSTDGTQDLAYKILPANSANATGITELYIDDANHASDIQYGWVHADSDSAAGSDEIILIGYDRTSNDTNAWVWNGTNWTNQYELSSNVDSGTFDGGDLVAVKYDANGTQALAMSASANVSVGNNIIVTRSWNGTAWNAAPNITGFLAGGSDAMWLTLEADPSSDDLQAAIVDNANDLHTAYWNGTAWLLTIGIETDIDRYPPSSTPNTRAVDFEWETGTNEGLLAWFTSSSSFMRYRHCKPQCNGATFTATSVVGGDWTDLARNPRATDTIAILGLTHPTDVRAFAWNGSGIIATTEELSISTAAGYKSVSLAFAPVTEPGAAVAGGPAIIALSLNTTNPSTNGTFENLTVHVLDVSGSAPRNITDWQLHNGTGFTSIAVINMPFEVNVSASGGAIRDHTTYNNSGTLGTSTALPVWNASGIMGGAYQFDGGDFISIPNSTSIDFMLNNKFSFSVWLYRTGSTSTQHVFGKRSGCSGTPSTIQYQLAFDSTSGLSFFNTATFVSPSIGSWYHVVATYGDNVSAVYINGLKRGEATETAWSAVSVPLYIGTSGTCGGFEGLIDDTLVFNRTLNAEEIESLYAQGLQGRHQQTLSWASTQSSQTWIASVTPAGPAADGTSALSNNITIQNNAPTIQQVVLNTTNPATNDTNQNLTAYVNNATDVQIDVDHDRVENITDWRINDTSIMTLNLPFEQELRSYLDGAAKDYTVTESNGTLGGSSIIKMPRWTLNGKVGAAYYFDSSDDYIKVPFSADVNFTYGKPFSIAWWMYWNGTGDIHIFGRRAACGAESIPFQATIGATDGLTFGAAKSGTVPDKNVWHHVVGVMNGTEWRLYVNGTLVATNLTAGGAITTDDLHIGTSGTCSSKFAGYLDEFMMFNRSLSAEQVRQLYNGQLSGSHTQTIHSNETSANDRWQACVTPNDNTVDGALVCSNNVTITAAADNQAPTAPVLLFPANNSNVTSRSPNFNWSNSTDPEGVSVNYSIEISTNPSFSSIVVNTTGINSLANSNTTNFTISQVLNTDTIYWWRVIATDGAQFSPYSGVFNFTLQSFLSITLINDTVNFGNVTLGIEKNTTNESVFPFLLENTGNVFVNITVTGEKIFQQAAFPSASYRYKARANESGAFNTGASTMTFTNVTNVSTTKDIVDLNWTDSKDDAKIDVQIVTPTDEPPGVKNSTFTFTVA